MGAPCTTCWYEFVVCRYQYSAVFGVLVHCSPGDMTHSEVVSSLREEFSSPAHAAGRLGGLQLTGPGRRSALSKREVYSYQRPSTRLCYSYTVCAHGRNFSRWQFLACMEVNTVLCDLVGTAWHVYQVEREAHVLLI